MDNNQNILDQYFRIAQSQDCDMTIEDVNILLDQHVANPSKSTTVAKKVAFFPVRLIVIIIVAVALIVGSVVGILLGTGTLVYTAGVLTLNQHSKPTYTTNGDATAVRAWAHAANVKATISVDNVPENSTLAYPTIVDSISTDESNPLASNTVRPMPWTQPAEPRSTSPSASVAPPARDADAVMYEEFNACGENIISAKSAVGRIEIIGYAGNKVTVSVHLQKQGRRIGADDPMFARYAEEFVHAFGTTTTQDTCTVSIICRKTASNKLWRGVTPTFVIYTPYRSACFINNSDCTIDISGATAETKNITANGGVNLRDLLGITDTLTSGEGVFIKGIRGNLLALSVAGAIELSDIDGNIDICTIVGNIRLSNIRGTIDATSMHGTISANHLTGNAELETTKGNIHLTIEHSQGASINMEGGPVSIPREQFVGTITDESAHGDINEGGSLMNLSTNGGAMRIEQE